MTFRLPFKIFRVGAIYRWILRNYQTTYVPIRCNTTESGCEYLTKPNLPQKSVQKARSELVEKCGYDYCQKIDETQAKSKMMSSIKCNKHVRPPMPKYDCCRMEDYYNKIKDIGDQITTTTTPLISQPSELDKRNIMPDTELKIQNDIGKQSGSEILNNLNSENSIWRFINGKRKPMKHTSLNELFTSKMFMQSPATTKTETKNSTIQLNTKPYPQIDLSTKRKAEKLNFDNTYNTNKVASTASRLQPELLNKIKTCKSSTERKADLEIRKKTERIMFEYLKNNVQTFIFEETKEIPNILRTKNSTTDGKNKICHLPTKIFVRHKSKSSEVKPNTSINVEQKYFSKKLNVIMTTVNNRILNSQSPEFIKAYSYNNSFYQINAMKDLKSLNNLKYPIICYDAENDTYLLNNELVAENIIPNESKIAVNTCNKTDEAFVSMKPTTSDKIIKSISGNKLSAESIQKDKSSLKTTNKKIAKQCSLKSQNLNKAVSDNEQKLVKIKTPLSKKEEPEIKKKIKSTKIPKTLGEIYGEGKIPFLVEVSKPGHAKHKQYLVVIQLPRNQNRESSENSTDSPLPMAFGTDLSDDYYEETLLCPNATITNCLNEKTELFSTKLSQLIQTNKNKKENDIEWAQKAYAKYMAMKGLKKSINVDEQSKVVASCPPDNSSNRYKEKKKKSNTIEYMINQQKPNGNNHVRHYSTLSRRYQTTNPPNSKISPQALHNNRTFGFQQKCNLCSCLECPYCGKYPCTCGRCSPCGWYPCCSYLPKCCPRFRLENCCCRARWDCEIPIPPCQKIEAPYASFGECMPTWFKEPTECFDFFQHKLQPKNQVSTKIDLMEESIPKVTVVDPSLDRKCCRDKWCEPCPPYIDQRIYFDCPHKVPVDNCCPRGRPHCYCWPERPSFRKPPPYRCFSDEDLEFPEVEITENDLARRFASDLYRRMGRKCPLPFSPVCSVDCDLRSGEPIPVCSRNPRNCCSTTCFPPGTYPATCTYQRIPPCQTPYDTCINCCMPTEGIRKTRCSKRYFPVDCCGYCPLEVPCCPKEE